MVNLGADDPLTGVTHHRVADASATSEGVLKPPARPGRQNEQQRPDAALAPLPPPTRTCSSLRRAGVRGGRWRCYDAPLPMPSFRVGWFQVAYSEDLDVGAVPLHYFGQHLVLFRGEDQKLGLLDAYCPHLGAHLGHGGRVEGNSVVCPFHAWKFDCTGACTDVPYATRQPKRADTRAWHVVERSGLVLAWYHPDGEAPHWDPPEAPEYGHPEWTDYTRKDWIIRTHNQEMAENAVDSAHFHYLHGTQNIPPTEAEREGHILHMKSPATMTQGQPVEGKITDLYGFGYTQTRFWDR